MSFWIAALALLACAGFWLARPLLRRGDILLTESQQSLSIYRDQIDEVSRDAASGLIDVAEAEEARREIELRALRAAGRMDAGVAVAKRQTPLAAGIAALICAGSLGGYLALGEPGQKDQPLAARQAATEARLAELKQTRAPAVADSATTTDQAGFDDFDVAWAEAEGAAAEGDYARAAEAYRRAAAASNDRPDVVSAYAEALTLANGNKVPPGARLAFQQVLARDPANPRARYYAALAKAQEQDFEGALIDWLALLQDSSPEASWTPLVIRDVTNMARFLERDPADVLPAWVIMMQDAEAFPLTPNRVAAPADASGWESRIEAAIAMAEGGDVAGALAALDAMAADYAGAPFLLAQIDAARDKVIGTADGAQQTAATRRGPTEEQVAAASALSTDEQNEMIRGMVDGLAARLQNDPSDVDGWLMLIRSYAVLQDVSAAENAVRTGAAAFPEDSAQRAQISRLAAELGLESDG